MIIYCIPFKIIVLNKWNRMIRMTLNCHLVIAIKGYEQIISIYFLTFSKIKESASSAKTPQIYLELLDSQIVWAG